MRIGSSYADNASDYFAGERRDIVDRLSADTTRAILEIGCGAGATGAVARQMGKCGRYVGVELLSEPAEIARCRLSTVHVADIEQFEIPDPPKSYDVLIASEVLEHLIDPWRVLSQLKRVLKPGALVFASSPNIAHHTTISMLLGGEWRLEQSGRMDRTHLRWFTPRSYGEMFRQCGFEVLSIEPVTALRPKARMFNFLTGGRFEHLFISQILITARAP